MCLNIYESVWYVNVHIPKQKKDESMENESTLDIVMAAMKKRLGVKKIKAETPLSPEDVEAFLRDEGILVIKSSVQHIVTVGVLARYVELVVQQAELVDRVKKDLANVFDEKYATVVCRMDLSCIVDILKTVPDGFAQQQLSLQYYLTEDDEIGYKLPGSVWSWNISRATLANIVANTQFSTPKLLGLSVPVKKKKGLFSKLFKHKGE